MATGFRVKTFGQISASMINWFASAQSQITDFNTGSVARTLLEAIASEITEVYFRIYGGILAAQQNAVFDSFDFPQLPAASAGGVVLWETSALPAQAITLPVGAQVAVPATSVTAQVTYTAGSAAVLPIATTLNGTINNSVTTVVVTTAFSIGVLDVLGIGTEQLQITAVSGNSLTVVRGANGTTAASHTSGVPAGLVAKAVPMTADVPGAAGNAAASALSVILTPITGITAVTNPAAMTGGADAESDDARKKRFNDFISGLARGTKPAIEFGALSVTVNPATGVAVRCVKAKAVDLDDDNTIPPGTVKLYVTDSAGSMSTDLHDAVAAAEEAYRPAGVQVVVAAPTLVPVNVTATLTVNPGFNKSDLVTAVTGRLTDLIDSLNSGDTLYLARVYQVIIDTNPAALLSTTISAPAGDTAPGSPAYSHLIRPGTLAITAP